MPKGLDGEEPVEDGEGEDAVKFERRRAREKRREKSGKRKSVKTKDWILKKKEVSNALDPSLWYWRETFRSPLIVALSSKG